MADLFSTAEYPKYLQSLPSRLRQKYDFVRELGGGKNGKTFLVRSSADQYLYCLKTISYDVKASDERERVRTTLEKEVAILKPPSHRCLPLVFENDTKTALPYYICTFHPGETWEKFRLSGKKLRLDEAFFIVASLIDVLEYIHEKGRTHCDLHNDNILGDYPFEAGNPYGLSIDSNLVGA